MTEVSLATSQNLKKPANDRLSISKADSYTKKNHFVDEKKSKLVQKKSSEFGFEYYSDVKSDVDFYNKIFTNNCYNPTAENLIDYYLEIRRMIDESGDKDEGNVGTVLGMTVIGLFGFLGFSFTIIGGIAGGVIGGTLGRYAGKKLRRKIKRKGPLTQEQLYITKLQCVVKMGKLQRGYFKHNLNKYRILIEKMIEEASMAINVNLFENQKKITKILLKFRDFLIGVQPQKAILLCYKLFKIHFKQVDYEDPESMEEISSKLNRIMIPYIRLIEIQEKTAKKKVNKLNKLISYQKIKKLLATPEVQSLLEKFPDVRTSTEYTTKFQEFLKQKVDLEQPVNNELEREIQAEAQEQFVGKDGAGSALAMVEVRPPLGIDILDDDDKCLTLEDIQSAELDEESHKKNIHVRTMAIPKSRMFEENLIGGVSIKDGLFSGKIFNPKVPQPKTPQSAYMDFEGNGIIGKLVKQVSKEQQQQRKESQEDSSDDSSISREQDQMSIDDAKKLVEDSALYDKEESVSRRSVLLNSLTNINGSNKKKKSPRKDLLLILPVDEPENNKKEPSPKGKRTPGKTPIRLASPLKKDKTMSCDNVDAFNFDPTRTMKKPELVKVNSFSNGIQEEEHENENNREEEQKDNSKNAQPEQSHRSTVHKDAMTPRSKLGRTATITKENEEKFIKVVQQKSCTVNKTKKELVFEKIISIAYDNVSKWEKVISNPTVTIQKIKPENSPVILIRGWIHFEGFRPAEVFKQICDISERSRWDTVLAECAVLDKLEDDSELFYFCIKTPFGITERDFLQRRQYQHDYPDKGTIIMSFQSIEHPSKPPMKNKIRGETHIAGYIMKPSDKDPNSCDLCLITQVDIKGNIPKAITNMVAGRAPAEWVNKLKKGCEDFRKRNPNYKWE